MEAYSKELQVRRQRNEYNITRDSTNEQLRSADEGSTVFYTVSSLPNFELTASLTGITSAPRANTAGA